MAEVTGSFDPPHGWRWWEALRVYRMVVGMWVRSALAYRLSFVMMTVGSAAMTSLDFAAVAIIFGHTRELGGFSLAQTAFLYGTSGVSLGVADLLLGSMDQLGRRVRDGTLDTLMVRPAAVLRAGGRRPVRVAAAGPHHPGAAGAGVVGQPARPALDAAEVRRWCR